MSTVYKGIKVPDLTDPPNGPQNFRDLVDSGGAVPRFATLAEANTAYPAGSRPAGMMVMVGTRPYISDGTNFVSVSAGGVEAFTNRAARASAIPSPALGQVTTLNNWPGSLHTWDGTGWMAEQSGYTIANTDANGAYYLVFPRAFQANPTFASVHAPGDSNVVVFADPISNQTLATNMGIIVRYWHKTTGIISLLVSGQFGFFWTARGYS